METVYMICAVAGGTLLACQFLASLVGLGGHHDVGGHDFSHDGPGDVHHGDGHVEEQGNQGAWFAGVLTFRTLVAALTFFGLAGLAGSAKWGGEQPVTLLVALAAGGGALFLVATLMRSLYRLRADGTVRIDRAVGKKGTVYLSIPAARAGAGKVTLSLQNRTVEYQAVTADRALPTGSSVVVVAVLGPDTVEVAPDTANA
jgi:hypothetical protein